MEDIDEEALNKCLKDEVVEEWIEVTKEIAFDLSYMESLEMEAITQFNWKRLALKALNIFYLDIQSKVPPDSHLPLSAIFAHLQAHSHLHLLGHRKSNTNQ
jgi:hypothetical protein